MIQHYFFHILIVPGPIIKTALKDAVVTDGEDALFSIELSAAMIGNWFLNSAQLQDGERFSISHSKNLHTLRIHSVPQIHDGAEITFIATGVRDSAALQVKGRSCGTHCHRFLPTCISPKPDKPKQAELEETKNSIRRYSELYSVYVVASKLESLVFIVKLTAAKIVATFSIRC